LRLRRHSGSSLPPPPCLFTAFPACPPARLVTGYCSRSLYLARSLARALLFFVVLFFSRDLHILNPVLIFLEFLQSPGLVIFFCFGEKFLAKEFFFWFSSFSETACISFPCFLCFCFFLAAFFFFCVFFVPDLGLQLFCS
jgi:hypothetical protein